MELSGPSCRLIGPLAAALCLALAALAASRADAASGLPLRTAFVDPYVFTGPDAAVGLGRAAAAGASAIKVPLFWDTVVPASRPSGFKPANPSDPAYRWAQVDARVWDDADVLLVSTRSSTWCAHTTSSRSSTSPARRAGR